jgi:putative transcriptional regulator
MFIRDKGSTVVNSVRSLRTELKMTQDELASSVNATRQTIIAIEKGNYIPSVLLALKLAEVLNKSVEDIFKHEKV